MNFCKIYAKFLLNYKKYLLIMEIKCFLAGKKKYSGLFAAR